MNNNGKVVLVIIVAIVAFVAAFGLSFVASLSGAKVGGFSLSFWIMFGSLTAVVVGIVLALRNNRDVPMASDGEKRAMLSSAPPAGRGRLIVYRTGFVGKLQGFDIILDGHVVAQLKSPRFVTLDIAPGRHDLAVVAQGKQRDPLPLTIGDGEVAVVHVPMPLNSHATLTRQDFAAARATLATIPMVHADGQATAAAFA